MKADELVVSNKFKNKFEEIKEEYHQYKEVVHYSKKEKYETVILTNSIHTLFIIFDFYYKFDKIDISEIHVDDINIISDYLTKKN